VREAFASLTQPILLIWGSESAFTPLSEADEFMMLNPNAQLVVIDDASSLVNDEKRALFDQLALDHLQDVF
jgi:pimeloyl-ACP methyl ester carboxylesterase